MCGRYATTRTAIELSTLFEADDLTDGELSPTYNVAPTDPVPIVRVSASQGRRVLDVARWGFAPSWVRDPRAGARMINARAETVHHTPAYARAFAMRRCLVPADGWYEWRRWPDRPGRPDRLGKQAYFLTPRDGSVLALAGIWAARTDGVLTCSIITVAAPRELAAIHDRMPLVVTADRWVPWLATDLPATDLPAAEPPLADLLVPVAAVAAGLELRPVGPAVGDVRRNGPELIRRAEPAELTLF
jgi:putative SOS response-associated peptidase YedK